MWGPCGHAYLHAIGYERAEGPGGGDENRKGLFFVSDLVRPPNGGAIVMGVDHEKDVVSLNVRITALRTQTHNLIGVDMSTTWEP